MPGEVILQQNDMSRELFFVTHGVLEQYKDFAARRLACCTHRPCSVLQLVSCMLLTNELINFSKYSLALRANAGGEDNPRRERVAQRGG